MTNILIYQPSQASDDGLLNSLMDSPDISQVRITHDQEELLRLHQQVRTDVIAISLDVNRPLDLIAYLKSTHPAVSVLIVGGTDRALNTARAIAAGARGFLRHDATTDVAGLHPRPYPRKNQPTAPRQQPALTQRELEVLKGMSEGKSNGEIGREFFLSEDTIKTHARRLFRKIGAHDRAHAVTIGFRSGLLS